MQKTAHAIKAVSVHTRGVTGRLNAYRADDPDVRYVDLVLKHLDADLDTIFLALDRILKQ